MIFDPHMTASTPLPPISRASETSEELTEPLPAFCIDLDIGWLDADSAADAMSISSWSGMPDECTLEISKLPLVNVPVLSNTTVCTRDRVSM